MRVRVTKPEQALVQARVTGPERVREPGLALVMERVRVMARVQEPVKAQALGLELVKALEPEQVQE